MRRSLIVLLAMGLAGCAAAPRPQPSAEPAKQKVELPQSLRTCPALLRPLPRIRTPEMLKDREKELDLRFRECAERHRLLLIEFDKLNGDR